MGGLFSILMIIAPALLISDAVDVTCDYVKKRQFQRKMQARRGSNFTYN